MSIEIKNLTYTYNIKTPAESLAIDNISLSIDDGDFVALVGQTGSGKSTLAQCLNGLLLPTSGQIKIDNFLITPKKSKNKKIKELRKHISIMFQFPEYQLFEETVVKDVAFGLKNFGTKTNDAMNIARETLKKVGLDEKFFEKSPFELSGGEKRRVAFAGILSLNPDIFVLDEPTAGLDAEGNNQIMSIIQELHNQGKTIILITHDLSLVMKYCNKVCLLKKGKVEYFGKPEHFFDNINGDEINIPHLYLACKKIKDKVPNFPIQRIKSVDDLMNELIILRSKKDE